MDIVSLGKLYYFDHWIFNVNAWWYVL